MNKKQVAEPKPHDPTVPIDPAGKVYRYDTLDFNNDTIAPGDKIRFKNRRGVFTFRGLFHNVEKDVTWIDCLENKTGRMRAFYVGELKTVIRPKKSRRKKIV